MQSQQLLISAGNCQYRGEGNASLVVRLKKEELVLRLVKVDNSTQHKDVAANGILVKLELHISLVSNVMRPLLGYHFVHLPTLVPVSGDSIKIINQSVHNYRPVHRHTKSVPEIDTYALLLPDYCSLPPDLSYLPTKGSVLGVEIKPKQGFMLLEDCLPPDHSVKASICRFCMMQYYKLQKGAISVRSGYCPLDLFSGNPERIHHALGELHRTPQNNFRVFKDQQLVFCDEMKGDLVQILKFFFEEQHIHREVETFFDLITKALLMPFPGKVCDINKTSLLENKPQFCLNSAKVQDDSATVLPKGCVLDRILQVQRLDCLDITKVYKLFQELKSTSNDVCELHFQGMYPKSSLPTELGNPLRQSTESHLQYASRKVWEFLLALTAKDCSVMLVLKQLDDSVQIEVPPEHVIWDTDGNPYIFSIAVTDLDPKPLSKVEKVYNDSCSMLEAYSFVTSSSKSL